MAFNFRGLRGAKRAVEMERLQESAAQHGISQQEEETRDVPWSRRLKRRSRGDYDPQENLCSCLDAVKQDESQSEATLAERMDASL